jgi:hypothetical protein
MNKYLLILTLVIFFSFYALNVISQNQNTLCSPWCISANYEFRAEFGTNDCLYIIERTPNNQIIITGWCNYLFSIKNSKSKTFSINGVLLEELYNPNGWVESSFKTSSDVQIYHSNDAYPNCAAFAPCTTIVQKVKGVECDFLQNVANGALILPLEYASSVDKSLLDNYDKFKLGFIPITYPSYCLQGETQVHITCLEPINESSAFEICANFDNYSDGSIIPQGSPNFTLFSGITSQNAQVVNNLSFSSNKSLKLTNGSNIDFNISREISEDDVARVQWKMYIPKGKSGKIGLETNNASNNAFYFEVLDGQLSVFSLGNNGYTKVWAENLIENRWINFSIIFQPFENEIEFWMDYIPVLILKNYQSNKIEDLNFSSITNSNNNEFYIDDLCYKEWNRIFPCTAQYEPVCISYQVYGNSCEASRDGYTDNEYFYGECGAPACPTFTFPNNNSQNVNSSVTLKWNKGLRTQIYFLSVFNVNNQTIILQDKVDGNATSYTFSNLPSSTSIRVELLPQNNSFSALCENNILTFKTAAASSIPDCPSVTYPTHNSENLLTTLNISWAASPTASGYRLRVGTQVGSSNILNNLDIGNQTNYVLNNLPSGTNICFSLIPYNSNGQNLNCSYTCFKTAIPSAVHDELSINKISIYPNPAFDRLFINNMEQGLYTISNISGQNLRNGEFNSSVLPIQTLEQGFYILTLSNDKSSTTLKFYKAQ